MKKELTFFYRLVSTAPSVFRFNLSLGQWLESLIKAKLPFPVIYLFLVETAALFPPGVIDMMAVSEYFSRIISDQYVRLMSSTWQ